MDINIRGYIKENFKQDSTEELYNTIQEAINSNDEVTLPGLGVLFETFWLNITKEDQQNVVSIIKKNIN